MASYKVPQDVEADDKLLGPFSFRQFIYLMVAAAAAAGAWGLWNILPPLVVIPLPIILFFAVLALPLRKDQPMEIYLAAILSFYLKPRQRLWDPDGIESLVYVAAPRNTETDRTKGISGSEAEERLRYLSAISDTRGWSVRGMWRANETSMNAEFYNEAQTAEDVLDGSNAIAQNLSRMMDASDTKRHQEMVTRMHTVTTAPAVSAAAPLYSDPYAGAATPAMPQPSQPVAPAPATPNPFLTIPSRAAQTAAPTATQSPTFNPYPSSINQKVIQPLSAEFGAPSAPSPQSTSASTPSPDILQLASNSSLSIETIAREAHRIEKKEERSTDDEVYISLH